MENLKPAPVETEYSCPVTGKVMLLRQGRYGPFLGCSGYPECKKILKVNAAGEPIDGPNFTCGLEEKKSPKAPKDPSAHPNATQYACPEGRGVMILRQSRYGPFLGCSNYPKCRTALKIDAEEQLLPGQEFTCTYSESAAKKNGSKKNGASGTAKKTAAKKTTTVNKTTTKRATSKSAVAQAEAGEE
jgi:DNA topoisomerase-1